MLEFKTNYTPEVRDDTIVQLPVQENFQVQNEALTLEAVDEMKVNFLLWRWKF